jgi:hypothetical protein
MSSTLNSRALLIGINYVRTPESRLRGCVNDVKNMENFLSSVVGMDKKDIMSYVDEDPNEYDKTTAIGITRELRNLVSDSWKYDLDLVWFHYSGHGCSIVDNSGDEKDGKDEALVPSDYNVAGVISDDFISRIMRGFNPKTKVVCVFDCCHSGTIADLRYHYRSKDDVLINKIPFDFTAKIITLSGCKDDQTSADAFNVQNAHKFTGALTSCLINVFDDSCKNDVFVMLEKVRKEIQTKRFSQIPQICSTYDLMSDPKLLI